jgi:hypothetical protein
MMFVITLLIVVFFFAGAALVLFFLFDIFLPILGQQGIPVAAPLVSSAPDTVPDFSGFTTESAVDFLPPLHTSPTDCKVLEALHDRPKMRKEIVSAYKSCIRTCPRAQINFDALIENASFQETELAKGAPCLYAKESADTPAKQAAVWFMFAVSKLMKKRKR